MSSNTSNPCDETRFIAEATSTLRSVGIANPLSAPFWHRDPFFMDLVHLLDLAGIPFYLVGGSVRQAIHEALTGTRVPHVDYDLATPMAAQEVRDRLLRHTKVRLADASGKASGDGQLEGLAVVDHAIGYGTLVLKGRGVHAEITTFRQDHATDGRHAEVVFVPQLLADARRRDFTCNALYASPQGHIMDPTGQGLADLLAGQVRFVGDPDERIGEDHLRLLRLLRFHSQLSHKALSRGYKDLVRRWAHAVPTLSGARRWQEFQKLLETPNALPMLRFMLMPIPSAEGRRDNCLLELILGDQARTPGLKVRRPLGLGGILPPGLPRMDPVVVVGFFASLGLAKPEALPLSRREKRLVDLCRRWMVRLARKPSKYELAHFCDAFQNFGCSLELMLDVLTLSVYRQLWLGHRHHPIPVGRLGRALRHVRAHRRFLTKVHEHPFALKGRDVISRSPSEPGTPPGQEVGQILAREKDRWARHSAQRY